jgi:hypothetical protein
MFIAVFLSESEGACDRGRVEGSRECFFATPHQGILPKLFRLFLSTENKMLWAEEFRENSLKQNCDGKHPRDASACARPASGTRTPLSKTDQKELGQTDPLPEIHTRLTGCSSRIKTAGAQ